MKLARKVPNSYLKHPLKLLIAIWKGLQKKYAQLLTIIEILNIQVLALNAHEAGQGDKLKKELLLI